MLGTSEHLIEAEGLEEGCGLVNLISVAENAWRAIMHTEHLDICNCLRGVSMEPGKEH